MHHLGLEENYCTSEQEVCYSANHCVNRSYTCSEIFRTESINYSNLQLCITRKNITVNLATDSLLYFCSLPINHDKLPDASADVLIISYDHILS